MIANEEGKQETCNVQACGLGHAQSPQPQGAWFAALRRQRAALISKESPHVKSLLPVFLNGSSPSHRQDTLEKGDNSRQVIFFFGKGPNSGPSFFLTCYFICGTKQVGAL